ncbi:unnamed protein product [Rotaria socialis]|uniref:Uncharacterized protein n=1 Tax=Rotaria socialis TaxID=392032 RepID=A0A821QT83_9BILA|nr:unnamed protein product [Rotaria socialis]CAF3729518.1 unnamed protein product [Rotaria socialis]CAF4372237.1 unnamed protein product [Rotaria socialis]CAF4553837.1 unnamed protein product [Rotaria socialis]CAF4721273.1 unnamed protein product [Rotaria socialis]
MKSRKAPGSDEVKADILKAGGEPVIKWLHEMFTDMWENEQCGVLAEMWSETVIDVHPVVASFINQKVGVVESNRVKVDELWCSRHVMQTQYTIQIVRCNSTACCGPWCSNYVHIFPIRFLPPPMPFEKSSAGLSIASNDRQANAFCGTLCQRI